MSQKSSDLKDETYQGLEVFYGDLHNHSGLSYGHGSFDDAIKNAKLQLDFVSVTLHAAWPDIPTDDPRLGYLVDYHKIGFAKALNNWKGYLKKVDDYNQPGEFVTFPSYEWHSNQYGDYCIYYKDVLDLPIFDSMDLSLLRQNLMQLPTQTFLIPHHIGYKQGYRGINWDAFSNQISPVAEIFSFHGSSESSEGPYPYLHTMGPRNEKSSAQYGWSLGYIFGVVGSTDHHNAFPGSYGSGRLGVWAKSLTRDAIWESISRRRTYALTGDNIRLTFSLNGYPMGEICPPSETRYISASVSGGSTVDYIDLIHNNKVIHRECPKPQNGDGDLFKIYLELGWGEKVEATCWDVDFKVSDGEIVDVEPRFRGFGSQGVPMDDNYAYTSWERVKPNQVHFSTRTMPNTSLHTPSTEGMCFEIRGNENTKILAAINGKLYEHALSELMLGASTYYLDGFVSPAICFHRAIPQSEYQHRFEFIHPHVSNQRDWYYLRICQRNNQWAWSSPIWIEPS
jgi:hypothetical protein